MNQPQDLGFNGMHKIKLVELSVVLVADSNNPSILNPDFLRVNKIVDKDYGIQGTPISTPAFSQVAFNNRITVTSAPDRMIFSQAGTLSEENAMLPKIAKRYLECVPHVPYRAIGINPKGFISGQEPNPVAKMVRDNGSWMSFRDVTPELQLKAIYRYNERSIFLDIAGANTEENNKKTSGILFQANIHRDLTETDTESRIKRLSSILDSWGSDLNDFYNLTSKFREEG